jgi:tRNA threonylcarbamoyladenosine biosynthesis protein TsaE
MEQLFTLKDLNSVASAFANAITSIKVVAFHGEMGAGKTTFIAAICRSLGSLDIAGSPTFSLVNQYQTASGETIYHMDWYRLRDEEEAINAGIEDALYSGNRCFVEWPEKASGLLPDDTLHVWLEATGEHSRRISYSEAKEL